MSSRTLSAYFDDYRQGRKELALLQNFLLDVFRREPLRRGHLLNWLDQAQYEHPIPVTDFLLLRKEVEMALKSEPERTPNVEATLFNDSPGLAAALGPVPPAAPVEDDKTILAGQAKPTTAPASSAQDATLIGANPDATVVVNPNTAPSSPAVPARTAATTGTDVTRFADHRRADSGDYTPIPERSDHAGMHDPATSFDPRRQPTLTVPVPLKPPPRPSRMPLVMAGSVLALLAVLGGTITLQYWPTQDATPTNATAGTEDLNRLLRESPPGSVGPNSNPATEATSVGTTAGTADPGALTVTPPAGEDTPPAPALDSLDAPALLSLVDERIKLGLLLPDDDPATAHGALRELERRFANSTQLVTARKQLKDDHLKLSDQARAEGRWEAAQQHLDAAFNVLQPTTLTATAPSAGS